MKRLLLFPVVCLFTVTCGDDDQTGDGSTDDIDVAEIQPGDVDMADIEAEEMLDLLEEEEWVEPVELPPSTGESFAHLCIDEDWDEELLPGSVGDFGGIYLGYYNTLPTGTLETQKIIPEHPFQATTIRVAFAGPSGRVRIRLMRSFGHSYPDLDNPEGDLVPPIEMDLESPNGRDWIDIDISDEAVFLLPTEHYILVYEHLSTGPYLAVESLPEGEWSRANLHIPGEDIPYGVADGQYRMMLQGNCFCVWDEEDRWFESDTDQPFVADDSQRASFSDLDGDGHDDLILNVGGPVVYFGDGAGGFTAPDFDPFAEAPRATLVVFGDLDNDGDEDAFAAHYVGVDGDNDDVWIADGDCDDRSATTHPDAEEIAGNGIDDDCDGTADDGTDTSDADEDGFSIAEGDCNDTLDTVYPDAPELLDSRDNDCDGSADEDFVNAILLNDGTGRFHRVASSGVEVIDNSAAAALGDGNGDGNLDIYWGNWLVLYPKPPAVPDRYFEGNGDGTFVDALESAGLVPGRGPEPCYGVLWADYNNDGLQDIWVGNYGYEPNFLWHNNGDGTFSSMGSSLGIAMDDVGRDGGNTFGGDFGDFDNDGDLDLYAANIAHPRYQPWSDPSTFLVNQGPPDYPFVNRRVELGLAYDEGDVNAAFADFDNDMDLDLVVASLYEGHFSRLYRNDGEGGFIDVSYQGNAAVNDAVSPIWSDVDEDGDLDLVIAARTGEQLVNPLIDRIGQDNNWLQDLDRVIAARSGEHRVNLLINRIGQDNNWLQLVLEGSNTNRDAIGARVSLTAGGLTQIREVKAGGGHNIQGSRVVHFGLAQVETIDEVTVRWVGGDTETIEGLEPNGRYHVIEGGGMGTLLP